METEALIRQLESLLKAKAEANKPIREPTGPQEEKDPPQERPETLRGWHWKSIRSAYYCGDFDDDPEILRWLRSRPFPDEKTLGPDSWMN